MSILVCCVCWIVVVAAAAVVTMVTVACVPECFWVPGKTTFIRMLAGLLKADPGEDGKEPEIEGFSVCRT